MLTDLLFFFLAGTTLTVLLWTGMEMFRDREDPLGDRLEELQSQAMVAAQRTARRKGSGRGLDRVLDLVGLFPGGDDWVRGSERLLNRAGIRRKHATAVYVILTILFTLGLVTLMVWLQRGNPVTSLLGGLAAALILGFMLPKVVLQRLVKRYRARLQEALLATMTYGAPFDNARGDSRKTQPTPFVASFERGGCGPRFCPGPETDGEKQGRQRVSTTEVFLRLGGARRPRRDGGSAGAS